MAISPLKDPASRYAYGKRLRRRTPLERHADLRGSSDRDALAILAETDRGRIPALIEVRYERMAKNAFAFLRGAAAVMAADLRHQRPTGIPVQACGDCHLLNFGAFASPEDKVLFDINDFDETLPGVDFMADLKRLVASVAVAALDEGFSRKRARQIAASTAAAYRTHMVALAKLAPLEVWHSQIELAREVQSIDNIRLRQRLYALLFKTGQRLETDDNFPHLVKGNKPHIKENWPLIYHFGRGRHATYRGRVNRIFESYPRSLAPERVVLFNRYALKDTAFKVVGVGSVGTFCAIGLFVSGDGAPLFLQIKQAQKSVLEPLAHAYNGHQGQRVVEGQRLMQAASDIFLGWTEGASAGGYFYVRRLKNRHLGSVSDVVEEKALPEYARLCGRTLARAHARTGDPVVLAGYMGKRGALDDALASFALAYAERTQKDFGRLVEFRKQQEQQRKKKT